MSELVKRSIETLTMIVNVAAGATHALDDSRVKEHFKTLRKEGESLDGDTIEQLASANGWSARHARPLASLAQRIAEGERPVIPCPRG